MISTTVHFRRVVSCPGMAAWPLRWHCVLWHNYVAWNERDVNQLAVSPQPRGRTQLKFNTQVYYPVLPRQLTMLPQSGSNEFDPRLVYNVSFYLWVSEIPSARAQLYARFRDKELGEINPTVKPTSGLVKTFSALLALCVENSPISDEFPSQRPVTRHFGVFFDLRLNKRLSKKSWGWWFETPLCSLWRHCNGMTHS